MPPTPPHTPLVDDARPCVSSHAMRLDTPKWSDFTGEAKPVIYFRLPTSMHSVPLSYLNNALPIYNKLLAGKPRCSRAKSTLCVFHLTAIIREEPSPELISCLRGCRGFRCWENNGNPSHRECMCVCERAKGQLFIGCALIECSSVQGRVTLFLCLEKFLGPKRQTALERVRGKNLWGFSSNKATGPGLGPGWVTSDGKKEWKEQKGDRRKEGKKQAFTLCLLNLEALVHSSLVHRRLKSQIRSRKRVMESWRKMKGGEGKGRRRVLSGICWRYAVVIASSSPVRDTAYQSGFRLPSLSPSFSLSVWSFLNQSWETQHVSKPPADVGELRWALCVMYVNTTIWRQARASSRQAGEMHSAPSL